VKSLGGLSKHFVTLVFGAELFTPTCTRASRLGADFVVACHPPGTQRHLMELPPATVVVVDECRHATANTWRKIIDAYPDAILLGLTATPCRSDDRGLGGIFEVMIFSTRCRADRGGRARLPSWFRGFSAGSDAESNRATRARCARTQGATVGGPDQ
jgi:hypothetical protein